MKSLSKTKSGIAAVNGSIYFQFENAKELQEASVHQNSLVLPIVPDENNTFSIAADILSSEMLDSSVLFSSSGEKIPFAFNSDVNWQISGGDTGIGALKSPEVGAKYVVAFNGNKHVNLQGQACQFSMFLGCHGMSIVMEASAKDKDGRTLASAVVTVDQTTPGGQSASLYKPLQLSIPGSPVGSNLEVSFSVESANNDDKFPPCLLISDPKISPKTRSFTAPPLILQPQRMGKIQGRVDLDFSRSLDDIVLKSDRTTTQITIPHFAKIEAKEVSDRSWQLRADQDGSFSLYVDSNFIGMISVGPEWTEISIPPRFLDGNTHLLELRDRHGLRIMAQSAGVLRNVLTPFEILQREASRPLPKQLANQAHYRYSALEKAIRSGLSASQQSQLVHAHEILEKGFDNLRKRDFMQLIFETVKKPDVSIVIPVHNKFEITYYCLCALLVAQNDATFEVIVVDDGSSDDTLYLRKLVKGIQVVRNETAQRFLRACNAGVAQARGEYVVLLNNDTEPTVGWLDELIDPFDRFDNVGLTGSKLLYPDGTLQEAGGIVWRSGNPWNYGRNENPMDPRYCYTRDTHYVSGAAMMTTRKIWDQLGGLSEYLAPMYFEDTDFAFKIRDAGLRTIFAPHSVVYHFEGKTSGTEVTSGMKAFQETNRPKFKTKWAKRFSDFGLEGKDVDLEKDREIVGRVLFIDNSTPRPDTDAGSYAAVQEMKLVQSLGFKCTFLPRNLAFFGRYTDDLTRQGIEVITAPFVLSVQEYLEKHGRDLDVVYITRYYVAEEYLDAIRKLAPQAKIILMNADLHFLREIRTALLKKDKMMLEEASITRSRELAVMERCDLTISYNDVEHSVIASHALDRVTIAKCPWVVEARNDVPSFEKRSGIAFLGGYAHPPNQEAVLWFAENVMAQVISQQSDLVFHVYGSKVPKIIEDLESENIIVPGFVDHVSEMHDKHRIFVAPLLTGAGIKGKVLGALAEGIPCVLSPVAAEGIGLRNGYDCFIAKTPEEWVNAIRKLNSDKNLWQQMADNARNFIEENYSFERGRHIMRDAFHAVGVYKEK